MSIEQPKTNFTILIIMRMVAEKIKSRKNVIDLGNHI